MPGSGASGTPCRIVSCDFYCCTVHVVTIIYSIPTHAHFCTLCKIPPTLSWKLYITDDNDVLPHPVQEHNERTYTEFSLVTA